MQKVKILEGKIISISSGQHSFEDENSIEEFKEGSIITLLTEKGTKELYFAKKLSNKYLNKKIKTLVNEKKSVMINIINEKNVQKLKSYSRSIFIIQATGQAFANCFLFFAIAFIILPLFFDNIAIDAVDNGVLDFFSYIFEFIFSKPLFSVPVYFLCFTGEYYFKFYKKVNYVIPGFGYLKYIKLKTSVFFKSK